MSTISGIILKEAGWKINAKFLDIKKSITIFAPHTSYYDAVYGKLAINEIGMKHMFLSKKELFFFPMNIIMKLFGSIPVRGVKNSNAIYQVVDLLNNAKELHVVVSPEGTRSKVTKWNKGFYYMAKKAKVPIIVGYIDYKKKELGIKGVINQIKDYETTITRISRMYENVHAKYPAKFSINTNLISRSKL